MLGLRARFELEEFLGDRGELRRVFAFLREAHDGAVSRSATRLPRERCAVGFEGLVLAPHPLEEASEPRGERGCSGDVLALIGRAELQPEELRELVVPLRLLEERREEL